MEAESVNQTQVVEADRLVLRRAGGADAESLAGMLGGLPDFSLYMRFQTAIGKPPRPALVQQLLCPNGAAWVAERDCEVVGHAMWAWVKGTGVPTVELALIVAEPEQRRGLGVRMLTEAAHDALASGAAQFVVMVSAMNDKVLRMIRRRWPTATTYREGALLNFTIPAADFFAAVN
jgi:GNAT superfamily N-acetyltransferase